MLFQIEGRAKPLGSIEQEILNEGDLQSNQNFGKVWYDVLENFGMMVHDCTNGDTN